jgi:preprotein translocase subunit SecG
MLNSLLVVIAILAAAMVLVVLIQAPKGRGLDANFGGAAANNLLGASQSADFIEKLTWGLAGGIVVLCLAVAFLLKPNTPKVTGHNTPKMEVVATYQA